MFNEEELWNNLNRLGRELDTLSRWEGAECISPELKRLGQEVLGLVLLEQKRYVAWRSSTPKMREITLKRMKDLGFGEHIE